VLEEEEEEEDGVDGVNDDDSQLKVMKRLTQDYSPTKRKLREKDDVKVKEVDFWEKGG
jgi:hypothetical protein